MYEPCYSLIYVIFLLISHKHASKYMSHMAGVL